MQIIQPKIIIEADELNEKKLGKIERAAKICYQQEEVKDRSSFVAKRIHDGHESVIEHEKISAHFICDRGVTHEVVRHRIAAYSQESTRYCNYAKEKFGSEITVIRPFFFAEGSSEWVAWWTSCTEAERQYLNLMGLGRTAQEARSVLPNSLKTHILVTFNMREWRHFFSLRAAAPAHPQMRQLAIPLLHLFQSTMPVFFGDLDYDHNFPIEHYAAVEIVDNPDDIVE